MAIRIDSNLTPRKLVRPIQRLFELSAEKLTGLSKAWDPSQGAPVFTVQGKYTSRSWTEWTQGFQFGSLLLQFEVTGEKGFLVSGRRHTIDHMPVHISHLGVHDHGFNIVSTYGNLLRLVRERKVDANEHEVQFFELGLKISGAVQAARWTQMADGGGFIYSFNGPHSLFIDTMRSLRSLAIAHVLGHVLLGEHDERISLLERLLQHAEATARHAIYYGKARDIYDRPGRTAQESIFNVKDGRYRCPNSQQGYSPYSTWTRGLGWALLGFAEQLEFLDASQSANSKRTSRRPVAKAGWRETMERAALATADLFLESACADGIPMWDTDAPNLPRLGDYGSRTSDPFNEWEPVDSSAGAILAQGLIRLGNYLVASGNKALGQRYRQAGLTTTATLLQAPYLSTDPRHQGLLLHSVYHRPNGWDFVARGQKVPNGESSMWGDYHLLELALLIWREARDEPPFRFFSGINGRKSTKR